MAGEKKNEATTKNGIAHSHTNEEKEQWVGRGWLNCDVKGKTGENAITSGRARVGASLLNEGSAG